VLQAQYGTSSNRYALKVERMLTNQNMTWIGDGHAH
jgi:flagellar motor switch protein FliM